MEKSRWIAPRLLQPLSQINALQDSPDVWESEDPLQTQDLTDKGLPEPSSFLVWRALDALRWRDWFTRVWIIQEITLAKEVMVTCGYDQIPWRAFEVSAKFILQHSLIALTGVDPKRILKLSDFRAFQVGKGRRDRLLVLLTQARESCVTDDRDKIYAVLGLATEDDKVTLGPGCRLVEASRRYLYLFCRGLHGTLSNSRCTWGGGRRYFTRQCQGLGDLSQNLSVLSEARVRFRRIALWETP